MLVETLNGKSFPPREKRLDSLAADQAQKRFWNGAATVVEEVEHGQSSKFFAKTGLNIPQPVLLCNANALPPAVLRFFGSGRSVAW
jgi:hypothetical protein